MPSILRRSSPRGALSDTRLGLPWRRGFATTVPVIDAFPAPRSPCEHHGAWVPVHAPLCQGNRASLDLGVVRRLLQPIRRADTPSSRRSSRASKAFTSLPAPGRPRKDDKVMPAALASGCVAAPRACEPQPARTGFHRRVPLAWTKQVTGRSTRGRRARALDDSACPSRGAPGTRVTGSTHHLAWTTW